MSSNITCAWCQRGPCLPDFVQTVLVPPYRSANTTLSSPTPTPFMWYQKDTVVLSRMYRSGLLISAASVEFMNS